MTPSSPISAPATGTRWVRVGASGAKDAAAATAEATATALALSDDAPSLLLVFANAELDFEAVAAAIAPAVSPDVPVVGCSAAAGMATSGVAQPTVVVA